MKSKDEIKYLVRTINGVKELTREEMIQAHRDMWNWIAEQLKLSLELNETHLASIYELKAQWLQNNGYKVDQGVTNKCFCCEYAMQKNRAYLIHYEFCHCCPLNWGEVENRYNAYYCDQLRGGLYRMCCYEVEQGNLTEAIEYATQIANLPESEGR